MNLWENLKMALGSIAANKMRSLLTMLGIIIGISAVITITTLGSTLRSTVKGALDSLGSNQFGVFLNEKNVENYYDTTEIDLTSDDLIPISMVEELTELYPGQFSIGGENPIGSGTLVNSLNKTVNVNIVGSYDGTLDYNGSKVLAGRNLTLRDIREKKFTCAVSSIFVKQYFKNEEEPVGQTISITFDNGTVYDFTIVGVYKYNSLVNGVGATTSEKDMKTPIYIPNSIANMIQNYYDEERFYGISILYNTDYDAAVLKDEIKDFFDEKYQTNPNWGVRVISAQEEMKMIDIVINVITIIVSVIAAISLIVGGVGVMNIMLVSVTERTREIGVRKALGAKKSSIKMQFVTEAIIICLIGGLIGVLIGLLNGELVGFIANLAMKMLPEYKEVLGNIRIIPSIGAIIISLIFSMLTGVFFGLYPASKAAKMNPIDALRYD